MLSTSPNGKVARTSATKSSFNQVMRYQNKNVVARIRVELLEKGCQVSEDEAQTMFDKTKAFLWRAENGGPTTPEPDADEGWHTFILFTMDYQKFCDKYFGRFIHHVPILVGASKCKVPCTSCLKK